MFVLPGFIDMHGHIGGTSQGAEPDYVFKLWLGHGITTVREPGGRGIDYSIDLKNKSNSNEIVAPRLIIYSTFGSGFDKEITSPEIAREWVRHNAKKGADGIKFFGADPNIMNAALEENNKLLTENNNRTASFVNTGGNTNITTNPTEQNIVVDTKITDSFHSQVLRQSYG